MRLRSYLFTLSLFMLLGCKQTGEDHSSCETMADSLEQTYSQTLDSLHAVIRIQGEEISALEGVYNRLVDSLDSNVKSKDAKKIPKTEHLGLETKVPHKGKVKDF